jgi:hypothetical protein
MYHPIEMPHIACHTPVQSVLHADEVTVVIVQGTMYVVLHSFLKFVPGRLFLNGPKYVSACNNVIVTIYPFDRHEIMRQGNPAPHRI